MGNGGSIDRTEDMISEIHSSETPSAVDAEGEGYDHSLAQTELLVDAIRPRWRSYEVNVFNCYKHRQHLFNKCKDGMIHCDVLISFWMISGYLSPVESVDEAYKKGSRLLRDLIRGGLLKTLEEDPNMIELVGSTCTHGFTPCDAASVGFLEMLNVDKVEEVVLTDGMTKKQNNSPHGNYLCRQVFQSQRGLKYISHFNPTPNSLNPLLKTVNNPSVLMLRGFDDHLFPLRAFTFENFKTLRVLQISGFGVLTHVPLYHTISKLTQLRYLYLSDPLIDSLPEDLFSKIVELRWLILRGCSRLDFNLSLAHMKNLEVLDLSYTSTTELPRTETANLTHVFLRDSALKPRHDLLSFNEPNYMNLKFVDLSGNKNLTFSNCYIGHHLVVRDLSATQIDFIDLFWEGSQLIRNLILRECTKLQVLWWKNPVTDIEVLDFFGCENLAMLPEDLCSLKNMKELNLAGCGRLPNLREGFFDQMTCLVKLDLSETKFNSLPSFANLISLRELKLSGLELNSLELETWTSLSNIVKLDLHGLMIRKSKDLQLDFLPCLLNLQTLNLSNTLVAKLPDISNLISLKELLLADCWNLKALPNLQPLTSLETLDVSLPDHPTRSCKLQVEPEGQRVLPLSLRRLVLTNRPYVERLFLDLCGTNEIDLIRVPLSKKSENLQEQRTISKAVEFHIIYDVEHTGFDRFIYEFEKIAYFISKIQTSSTRQFEMLHAMKYIRENIDRLKGSHNSKSSDELLHELVDVATRNHLSADNFKDDSQNLKQLLRLFVRLKISFPTAQMNDREATKTTQKNKLSLFIKSKQNVVEPNGEIANLQPTYQTLSRPQKNCLLCFSAFPCNEEEREKNTGVLKKSLVIKKSILIFWWVSEGFLEANNFQDNGKQMLEDLIEKGFIEPVMKDERKSSSFQMHYHVHSFVTAQAKSEIFFDFGREKNKWLCPYITRSKKECHKKTQDNFPTCTKLWANHKNSPRELESMSNVSTLLNANGSVIDIKPEWFSKMEQLSTLSLGCWGCSKNAKNIEILDQKFLEELKSMEKLRLISLQGLMNIMKLPKSICMLKNLIILDLRECGYLEELPTGIGSLRNLIHLDLTDCFFLNKIPKGISLLSNLEVLKGFKITESLLEKTMKGCMSVIHDKDKEVCTLRDLSNLEKLYKLSFVVRIKDFPSKGDLEVLTRMKCLRKLKILWEIKKSIDSNNASGSSNSTQQHFDSFLDNDWELEKLELWCIPYKTLPDWLFSVNLEKLYIVGGDLVKLCRMNAKTLRLKYLKEMRNVAPIDLKIDFKRLTYMEIKECSFCSNSIWWNNGECIWDLPKDSYPGVFFRPRFLDRKIIPKQY